MSRPAPGLALLVAAAILSAACGPAADTSVPSELHGRWTTDEPRYADTWVELSPTQIRFRTIDGTVEGYPITAYRAETSLDGEIHLVDYRIEDGTSGRFSFFRRGDEIRLRNQGSFAWRRIGS